MQTKIDVLTAEAVPFALEHAGIGSRVVAALIDTLIQVVVASAIVIASTFFTELSLWVVAVGAVFIFAVLVLYHPLFETVWAGQTPGKRRLNLRVVKVNGQPIGAMEAFVRGIVRILDVHVFCLGLFVMFVTRQSQRLGDYFAGTVVIKERPVSLPELVSPDQPYSLPEAEVATVRRWRDEITMEELTLVRQFLDRRDGINAWERKELAVKLATLARKVKVGPRSADDAEAFLEDLARICME